MPATASSDTEGEVVILKVEDTESEDEESYGTILKLSLSISEHIQEEPQNNIEIEKIVIGEEKQEESTIPEKEKEEIKQYLAEIYYINKDCINVN